MFNSTAGRGLFVAIFGSLLYFQYCTLLLCLQSDGFSTPLKLKLDTQFIERHAEAKAEWWVHGENSYQQKDKGGKVSGSQEHTSIHK